MPHRRRVLRRARVWNTTKFLRSLSLTRFAHLVVLGCWCVTRTLMSMFRIHASAASNHFDLDVRYALECQPVDRLPNNFFKLRCRKLIANIQRRNIVVWKIKVPPTCDGLPIVATLSCLPCFAVIYEFVIL